MALDAKLRHHIQQLLMRGDDGSPTPRLADDAARLWRRVQYLLSLNLVGPEVDGDAMELACYALQLPLRQAGALPVGKFGQISLRDRAQQAAELLIGSLPNGDEQLLDRVAQLLLAMPGRSPQQPEARLLADAVNLEDFGALGVVGQAILLARHGGGLDQLLEGWDKRVQYGYWDVRLKDGFHFEPIRQMARRRLKNAEQAINLLRAELAEEQGT